MPEHTEFIWKTEKEELPGAMCLIRDCLDCDHTWSVVAGVKKTFLSERFYPVFEIEHDAILEFGCSGYGKENENRLIFFDLGLSGLKVILDLMKEARDQCEIMEKEVLVEEDESLRMIMPSEPHEDEEEDFSTIMGGTDELD